ncbi:MAG TPA: GDSL-type esterase/lipase family protein, partial [Chitinophagaceae bacterium]|nr:GDSL-type esterase/lipase family protein [Chitinophagaceae bacterium]
MSRPWLVVLFLFSVASNANPQPSQDPIRVACVGNSVTFGAGLKDPSLESYPAQLQKLLGDRFVVSNFGVSGTTLLQSGHRPYTKTQAFRDALAYNAEVTIIHLGLNDTDPRNWPNYRDKFAADYAWLIDTLRKTNPKMRVYVCRLTPIFSGHPRFKSGTRDWFWQIQELIPEIAKSNGAGL